MSVDFGSAKALDYKNPASWILKLQEGILSYHTKVYKYDCQVCLAIVLSRIIVQNTAFICSFPSCALSFFVLFITRLVIFQDDNFPG